MTATIVLMTDFGQQDTYVGVMKGVIHGICPDAVMIDLTHMIRPQHVRQAAFALLNAYRYFPPGTIFLIVVDPGVGSKRLPIAVRAGDYTFIAPDNGVLSYVLSQMEAFEAVALTNPGYRLPEVSQSFHGRDIFAPAAAHLAAGVPLDDFGDRLDNVFALPVPSLSVSDDAVVGEVVDIDHFGNIITNIGHLRWLNTERLVLDPVFGDVRTQNRNVRVLAKEAVVTIHGEDVVALHTSYSEVMRGDLLAMVGSSGYLEIAVNQGSAASRLDVLVGDSVKLYVGDVNAAIRN